MAKPSSGDPIYGKPGDSNDRLNGGDAGEYIYGFGGNDIIQAKGGNDTIYGGTGDDYILDGFGDDEVWAGGPDENSPAGNDRIEIGAGNDTYYLTDGGSDVLFVSSGWKGGFGDDVVWGFGSDDTLKIQGFDGVSAPVTTTVDTTTFYTYQFTGPNGGSITFAGYQPDANQFVFVNSSNA